MTLADIPLEPDTPCARSPRQARGRRRVDEILDAAESLIAEVGPGHASIQEIARRAGASVGSIYHFFPTKDALLAAIVERHAEGLRAAAACVVETACDRADGPLCGFVASLVDPFVGFIDGHPGYVALSRVEGRGTTDVGRVVHEAFVAALIRRFPGTTSEASSLRASMIEALGEGVLARMARAPAADRERLIDEYRRALAAYLGSLDDVAPTPTSTHDTAGIS